MWQPPSTRRNEAVLAHPLSKLLSEPCRSCVRILKPGHQFGAHSAASSCADFHTQLSTASIRAAPSFSPSPMFVVGQVIGCTERNAPSNQLLAPLMERR